jgi:hypothetical protein
MPAGQGKDAERFAAAVESGTPLGAPGDDELARDLEIVAMLRSRGGEFAPGPDVKARAKQRLMDVLAAEQAGPQRGPRPAPQSPPHPGAAPPTATERTAPIGRIVEPTRPGAHDVDPTAQTARMAPVTARPDVTSVGDATTDGTVVDTTAESASGPGGRARRRSRHGIANRPAGRARSTRRPAAGGLRRRVVLVGSAAMAMMIAIAGGGIFASQDALPGDNLYSVKRAAESAGLALTFDDAGKARRQLEIAATRLSEVERLSALEPQAAPAPEVFTTAMDEFDAATDEGSQMLLAAAGPDASSTAEGDLRTWASEQSQRLTELRPALPAAAEADESIELLERLLGRTESVDGDTSCDEDECAPGRTSDTNTPESGEADAGEDTTTTPDESDPTGATETDDSSRTPTETSDDGEEPGLLPDLTPDADREGEGDESTGNRSEDEESSSPSDSESGDGGSGDSLSVPLPLLPPVTLPPLLPGMPGITIG